MPSTASPVSSASNCCARSKVKTATSSSRSGNPKRRSRHGRPAPPSKRTRARPPTRWPQGRRSSSSRLYWTLRAPANKAGRSARTATTLSVAVALVVALASGCTTSATPAPVADTTYGAPIEINTPQGLRAKQTIDMLNSDWPIGTVGVRTMAAPQQVDAVTSAMGNLWLDRPITVTGIEIGAGQATLHTLTPYGAAQDIELRTNADGFVDRFAVKLQPPKITEWRDIDTVLAKTGARYSYQVSRVNDGKCEAIAGTNADLSLPLASIMKLYVLLAVADAVKAGTVHWTDQLTI